MKARELISGSSFGPEALHVLFQAFDAAWNEIARNVGANPLAIEAARLKLANATLAVAREDSRDPETLKRDALQTMAMRYREVPSDSSPPSAA
jgi:hypothetical protein